MQNLNKINKWTVMGLTGLALGILFSLQSKSFIESVSYNRENQGNIFKEIQIVKESNDNLRKEIELLERDLANSNNQELAMSNIQEQIEKYRIMLGEFEGDLVGPGVALKINENIEIIWLNDIVNELYASGAEIIEINGWILSDKLTGFNQIPNGQVLLGGEIIAAPYEINAIGNSQNMFKALYQPGGIIERINNFKQRPVIEALEVKELKF